jgi:hypothetical protein
VRVEQVELDGDHGPVDGVMVEYPGQKSHAMTHMTHILILVALLILIVFQELRVLRLDRRIKQLR